MTFKVVEMRKEVVVQVACGNNITIALTTKGEIF